MSAVFAFMNIANKVGQKVKMCVLRKIQQMVDFILNHFADDFVFQCL